MIARESLNGPATDTADRPPSYTPIPPSPGHLGIEVAAEEWVRRSCGVIRFPAWRPSKVQQRRPRNPAGRASL